LKETLAEPFLEITLLVLLDLAKSVLVVALGVLGNLSTTMAVEHTEDVLPLFKLQVVDSSVLLLDTEKKG
jgi:hypothetical protein